MRGSSHSLAVHVRQAILSLDATMIDRAKVEGRCLALHQGSLPASAAAVRRPTWDASVGAGPALAPRPPPPQQGLLRQRRLG